MSVTRNPGISHSTRKKTATCMTNVAAMTATTEIDANTARMTGRTRALMTAIAMTAPTIVMKLSAVIPGRSSMVSHNAMNPTTNETSIRRMSALRPGRHFQSSSTWSR
jgi:hypothetical protein